MKKLLVIIGVLTIIGVSAYAMMLHEKGNKSVSAESYEHYYNNENNSEDSDDILNNDIEEDDIPEHSFQSDNSKNESIETAVDSDLNSIQMLVNKSYTLAPDYVPKDLVVPNIKFSFSYDDPKMMLRQEAATAMESLFQAAEVEGFQLAGVSGYRSYDRQFEIYALNLIQRGVEFTNQYSAMAGSSEHQTGLAMDISTKSISYRLSDSFATTQEGQWVAEHCHEYGFIIRYPKDKEMVTGYSYEPWHIRYVGIELATYLTEQNMTLDEYYGYSYDPAQFADTDYDAIIQEYYELNNISLNTSITPGVTTDPNEEFVDDFFDDFDEYPETDPDYKSPQGSGHSQSTGQHGGIVGSTQEPTSKPTPKPTEKPQKKPAKEPTKEPTKKPTQEPTSTPTETPEATPVPDTPAPTPEVSDPVTEPDTQQPFVTPTAGAFEIPSVGVDGTDSTDQTVE